MPDAPIPWQRIFRRLSLAYGWTPQEISELTLTQVAVYLRSSPQRGQRMNMEPGAARKLAADLRRQREAWVERQLQTFKEPPSR